MKSGDWILMLPNNVPQFRQADSKDIPAATPRKRQ